MNLGLQPLSLDMRRMPSFGLNLAPGGGILSSLLGFLGVGGTLTNIGNELQVTLGGTSGLGYVDIAVTPGRTYLVQVSARVLTSATANLQVYDGAGLGTLLASAATTASTSTGLALMVVPTTSVLRVALGATGTILNVAGFSGLSIQPVDW